MTNFRKSVLVIHFKILNDSIQKKVIVIFDYLEDFCNKVLHYEVEEKNMFHLSFKTVVEHVEILGNRRR